MSADVWWARAAHSRPDPEPPPPGDFGGPLMSGLQVHRMYGTAAHPNRADLVYGKNVTNIDAWASRLASGVGATGGYFRGLYVPGSARTTAAITACRAYGIKWLMLVTHEGLCKPTDTSLADAKAAVDHIARNAYDVCAGIEGLNEPNHNRGSSCGPDVPADWADTTVAYQKAIYQRARDTTSRTQDGQTFANADRLGTVPLVGSSLHDVAADRSYTQSNPVGGKKHWHQVAAAGIGQWITHMGCHTYSGGGTPLNNFGSRRSHILDALGKDTLIWATEAGDQNAIATTAGHHPASEAASATYGPRAILEFIVGFGYPMAKYELLDDYDPGTKDQVEANFGMYRTTDNTFLPTAWAAKPIVASVKAFLDAIADPAGTTPYVTVAAPYTVGKQGHAEVQHYPIQKADGTTLVFFYRDKKVWDEINRVAISVSSVNVTLTDAVGARTVSVGADVSWVTLR